MSILAFEGIMLTNLTSFFPFLADYFIFSQDQSQFSKILGSTQKMIFCLILLSLVSGYVTKRFGCAVNKTKVIRLNDIHE